MNKYLDLLKNKVDKDILQELSDIEFKYEGFHNVTFKAKYKNILCQLRVPTSNLVNHEFESDFLTNLPNVYYYKKGVLIRKWFEGSTIENIELNNELQRKIIQKVKEFHCQNIQLPAIDLFYYGKYSCKYKRLVEKYSDPKYFVTAHCDLNLKNILVDTEGNVELIDFEWVRKAHPLFDVISLSKIGFDKQLLKELFIITDEEFDEFQYICNSFDKMAYAKKYKKMLLNNDLEEISKGYTNKSYKLNNLFIQHKRNNSFNHLNKLEIFNNLDIVEKVIYEDKDVIIRNFIKNKNIDWGLKKNRLLLTETIAKLHTSKIKLKNNQIYNRIQFYVEKLKEHKKFNEVFDQNTQNLIQEASKFLKNEVPSHNDLNRENILLTINNKIKLIDLEYSSMNSKYFDLAYHCSDIDYDEQTEKEFILNYAKNTNFSIDFDEYFAIKAIVNFYGIAWSLTFNKDFNFDWLTKHVFNNLGKLKNFYEKNLKNS